MQLIYRGSTFDTNLAKTRSRRSVQPTIESPYNLSYRGITYRIDPSVNQEIFVEPGIDTLSYRGILYQSA